MLKFVEKIFNKFWVKFKHISSRTYQQFEETFEEI